MSSHQQGSTKSRKDLGSKSCSAITETSLLSLVCLAQIQNTASYSTLRKLTLPVLKPARYESPRPAGHFVKEPSNFTQIS